MATRPRRRSHTSAAIKAAATRQLSTDLPAFPSKPFKHHIDTMVVAGFPPPTEIKSVNAVAGKSWQVTYGDKKAWQAAGADFARRNQIALRPLRGTRVLVEVAIPVKDKRRRDPHNYTSTVIKPLIDGITNTGYLIPDDNAVWVTIAEPILYIGTEMRIRVTQAPETTDPTLW